MDASSSHQQMMKDRRLNVNKSTKSSITKETRNSSYDAKTQNKANRSEFQNINKTRQYLCKCKKSKFPCESWSVSSCRQREQRFSFRLPSSLRVLFQLGPFRRWWVSSLLWEALRVLYKCVGVVYSVTVSEERAIEKEGRGRVARCLCTKVESARHRGLYIIMSPNP